MDSKPRLIIAIGASAGGLTALEQFFDHLNPETGAAFVVVQHLLAKNKSELARLLARHTRMKVCRVSKPTTIKANHVYVLPEGKMMTIEGDTLILRDRQETEIINRAVDIFFKSLAAAWREKAMGIILSGTGSDGLEGAKAIEDEGGSVMVQDPSTTRFDAMPAQIVNKDHPSVILPPAELAESLNWHLSKLQKN